MKRALSESPSRMRPARVEVPRRRASCPSALSKISETTNSAKPSALSNGRAYTNRCPAASPRSRLQSVTRSGDTRVGYRAPAIRAPSGRKKWRSIHSSTSTPLVANALGGFTQHVLHDGQRLHRLRLLDHQGRIDAHLRIVDHREHAAREERVEDPARVVLGEQSPGAGHHEVHPDHQPATTNVAHDRDLLLPPFHL